MPHDRNGQVLQTNDQVVLMGYVEQVQSHDEYCNITVRAQHPAKPAGAMETYVFNASQLELIARV